MKLRYKIGNLMEQHDAKAERAFMLSSRAGSFYYNNSKTRYGGWFVSENGKLFRIADEINIAAPKVSAITNNLYFVEQARGKVRERFFVPFGENAIVYDVDPEFDVDLILDVREAHDERKTGKKYDVFFENGKTVIRFVKKTDKREDKTDGEHEFTFFVVVNCEGEPIGSWEEKNYGEDVKRNSKHTKRFVYRAARFRTKRLVVSASSDRNEALRVNERVANGFSKLVAAQRDYVKSFLGSKLESVVAKNALDSLVSSFSENISVAAGLPWHFKVQHRNEAVSLKALMVMGEADFARKILFRQLRLVKDGKLANRIGSTLLRDSETADIASWLFFRVDDYSKFSGLTMQEKELVEEKIVSFVDDVLKKQTKKGFAVSAPMGNWMFTANRASATIEMQALRLALYKFANKLTKNALYSEHENELLQKVRERFWNGEILADGLDDFTARPNAFLAAYIYPEMLSREEWSKCFESLLARLWLDWGGLATIDKKDARFNEYHTGELLQSYHNGDSWFWLNNIAAIVMNRIDKEKFKEHIEKIYRASRSELLWHKCVGMAGELSSAKELRSEGCAATAMGAATFIELCSELKI